MGFRCHRCILAARSDYFRAFLERSPAHSSSPASIPLSQSAEAPASTSVSPDSHQHNRAVAAPATTQSSEDLDSAGAATQQRGVSQQQSSQDYARLNSEHDASTSRAHTEPTDNMGLDPGIRQGTDRQLPQLNVSDVSHEVFQLVLEFAYSGSLAVLPPCWLKAAGAELLFEAAERYLMPLLKVLNASEGLMTVVINQLALCENG